MRLQYFVTKADSGEQVLIAMEPAMKNDLEATKNGWQSDWTSDFISDPRLEKYAAKTEAGEIVALGAYREDDHGISVFIADIEAQPESNPTLTKKRRYAGVGRMMIAYGIQLSIDSGHGGVVTFVAKTDELYEHYVNDFHAVPISADFSAISRRAEAADAGRRGRTGNFWSLSILNDRREHNGRTGTAGGTDGRGDHGIFERSV